MRRQSWQDLYAANQAAISAAMAPTAEGPGASTRTALADPAPSRGPLVHVPRGLDPSVAAPLVCMLHGCTQDPATFAAATRMNQAADRHGFIVVYPGQPRARNALGCWNWFRPEHQRRAGGEPLAIMRDIDEASARHNVDLGRVYVAGLSSGGAMALILAACFPDRIAAVAVHSGLAFASARDVRSAYDVMARGGVDAVAAGHAAHAAMGAHARVVPTMVIHGTADKTVAPVNARAALQQAMVANRLAAPGARRHDVAHPTHVSQGHPNGGHPFERLIWTDEHDAVIYELLEVQGLSHAWSGGARGAAHTDAAGPAAGEAMWRFFEGTTPG
jgi:poly(hydroxyalkanoate) depolymerase family esterase